MGILVSAELDLVVDLIGCTLWTGRKTSYREKHGWSSGAAVYVKTDNLA